jgi:hypothetical protein
MSGATLARWMDTTALVGLDKDMGLGRSFAQRERRKESGFSSVRNTRNTSS